MRASQYWTDRHNFQSRAAKDADLVLIQTTVFGALRARFFSAVLGGAAYHRAASATLKRRKSGTFQCTSDSAEAPLHQGNGGCGKGKGLGMEFPRDVIVALVTSGVDNRCAEPQLAQPRQGVRSLGWIVMPVRMSITASERSARRTGLFQRPRVR